MFWKGFYKHSEIVKFLAERQQSSFLIHHLSSNSPILRHLWDPCPCCSNFGISPYPPPPPNFSLQEIGKVFTLYDLKCWIVQNIRFGFILEFFFFNNHSDLNSVYVETLKQKAGRYFLKSSLLIFIKTKQLYQTKVWN